MTKKYDMWNGTEWVEVGEDFVEGISYPERIERMFYSDIGTKVTLCVQDYSGREGMYELVGNTWVRIRFQGEIGR